MSDLSKKTNDDVALTTRRQMLKRLGLAAGAIYIAPVLVSLSEARASSGGSYSSASGSGRRRGRRRRGGGRGSFSSAS
jgi:hypothetical protein